MLIITVNITTTWIWLNSGSIENKSPVIDNKPFQVRTARKEMQINTA